MSKLLEQNDPEVILPLLDALKAFYLKFGRGYYKRPNVSLAVRFRRASRLTGLPAPKTGILDSSESKYGTGRYGSFELRLSDVPLKEFLWTGLHEWRHLYQDSIVAWVLAYRCNGEQIIQLPVHNRLIRQLSATCLELLNDPPDCSFLRRTLCCPRYCGRAPMPAELHLADNLIPSLRNRLATERPLRVLKSMLQTAQRIKERTKRKDLLVALQILGMPRYNLFGGNSTARFEEVSQMPRAALRRVLLAELSERLAPAIIAAAERAYDEQFQELDAEKFAKEGMALYRKPVNETLAILESIFGKLS